MGNTMSGATIAIEKRGISIVTNSNGYADIDLKIGDIVRISYVGYKTSIIVISQTILDSGQLNVSLKLNDAGNKMDELVIIGYGSVRKSDLTGSVAKVTLDDPSEKPATSIEQLLQGRAAGVQITSNTGAPGGGITFSIRGVTSISGSNQPLIVIDGYPIDSDNGSVKVSSGSQSSYLDQLPDDNALANIDPADIESVEILKDASATAIYGSRASNGVVLITTKHGKTGRDRLSYNARFDISSLPKKIDVLNTNEYLSYSNEAYLNSGQDSVFKSDAIARYDSVNTNWQDLIYRPAYSQSHQLSLSGGSDKFKYAVSAGYLGQQGIVKNSRYDRGSLLINLDREISKRFKFGVSLNGSISKNKAAMQSSDRSDPSTSVVYGALLSRPFDSPLTADDQIDQTQIGNPLTIIELADDQNRVTTVLANMYLNYTLAPGLDFKVNGGVNTRNSRRDFYMPRGTTLGNLEGGYAYLGESSSFNYLTEYTLNYNRTINKKHRINAVGGYTWQQWTRKAFNINVLNFPNDNMSYYDLSSGSSISNPKTSTTQWGLASFIGRANYSFDNRYLATFTAREDGSTRLAEGNKWKFFPSIALGWNVSNEKFMRNARSITSLKLRGSYGLSGNQAVPVGATQARLTSTGSVANEGIQIGYVLENMANNTLHWELTKQQNIGLDMTLFRNRITFGFDYYKKRTDGLLIGLTIPPSNGFTQYNTNQGTVENKGYEFDLGAKILTRGLKWDVSGNISFNRNKIISLGPGVNSFTGPAFTAVGGQALNIFEVGYPIGSFYGYRIIGIYQNQEEVDKSPQDPSNNKPGSFKFKDISGPNGVPDGVISADDREIIGNPYPNFIFGLTNNLDWKSFSLSFLVLGNIGQDVINANRYTMDALARGSQANVRKEAYEGRWTGEGTSNTYPQATTSASPFSNRFTDFIVEDASFVRLKYVTLSYTFENNKIKFARNLKFYLTGSNLLTLTHYKGYDPEINSHGDNSMTPGIDNGSIPQYRSLSIGMNVGF
ncbi:SusC/RagA family TonB-linked outer membrane protein [Niabella ginsenosidivorans]|uniref:SusC/RagA family TonB-linked outer membrane protein n=1 Tax=Niabella ginsenosidivorans TaxID=1176587 RepID=UPI001470FD5F|nr:TonB-dependent receptor [Niabella ginsenosidivorans]